MPAFRAATRPSLHPLNAILLAFPVALFATALTNDIAYLATAEMQWSNFAAWAITGALVIGAPTVLWAIVRAIRYRRSVARGRLLVYLLLVLVTWAAGLVNAFQHSKDAWSSVGIEGLLLSILSTGCALAAAWIAFSNGTIEGEAR